MGYTTNFEGALTFDKPLAPEHIKYIQDFNRSRRMKRDVEKLKILFGGKHGLNENYGKDGEYFVNPGTNYGQDHDASILDYNQPPGQLSYNDPDYSYEANAQLVKEGKAQPGLWCQWTVNDDGTLLKWDEGEKFYHYVEWLQYLINHFFGPWGYKLNGNITWEGEDSDDKGVIIVNDNVITTKRAKIVYE